MGMRFAAELVERYRVAVSVAIHEPGKGDDRKTGPHEVTKPRELAADIINESLAAVNADIRVDHRSFEERGIKQEPTTHLGPAASEMERRGEASDRGDINSEIEQRNTGMAQDIAEVAALDTEIAQETEKRERPPRGAAEANERAAETTAALTRGIRAKNAAFDPLKRDGYQWWQRAARPVRDVGKAFWNWFERAMWGKPDPDRGGYER